ncbi:MAG: polyprenyl synthetase family protein [Cyclobacteriaceae bacterium]|nr:polyprenyl synthetase family protein [Cyclobacteriaceae bacterium]MDH5247821.1 polyprenyl synthetase family protein [Cyclobacteriaceae bacterium]
MRTILSQYQDWIELEVKKQKYGREPVSLYEPIRYLMGLGGKRLRPMLTLLSYALFKNDVRQIVKYAVAVETFHNFTLMHDDIMDKAPLRRGMATVHEKWNSNTAIMAGDVMLVKVYDMFLNIAPEKFKPVLSAFNKCAAEVCEGQQWDMEFEKEKTVTEVQYIKMIRSKTAVLLGFSLELGAILADAPERDCIALRQFGTNIGIGFQLMDDLLDAYADPKKFGKQVGGDIIANKKTFLLIKAIEKATGRQGAELSRWLSEEKFKKQDKVRAVKALYDSLGIPLLAEKKVNHYFKKGFDNLALLSCSADAQEPLIHFTKSLIARQS